MTEGGTMRHLKSLAVLAVTIAAFLVPATTAMAAPDPGYEEFAGCPDRNDNADMLYCFNSTVTGGHLQMGKKDTPITDPIVLNGGVTDPGQFIVTFFDGGKQKVPGGLVGITGLDWLAALFPGGLLEVYAESELAGAPGNPFAAQTGFFSLPLKVRLVNPLLKNTCYIGSDTNPIALNLTQGTTDPPPPNDPITGSQGNLFLDTANGAFIFRIPDAVLVDNAFAAPAAKGCDLLGVGVIDLLVNVQAGLPSPAGTNETVQEAEVNFAHVEGVYGADGIE